MCSAVVIVLIGTQAIARSRAGLGLTILALMGAFAMAYLAPGRAAAHRHHAPGRRTSRTAVRILAACTLLAFLFGAQFALYRILERFDVDPLADARIAFARNTIEAAIAYMPTGSGMGSFVPVYQAFEKVSDNASVFYANRAHNDLLEFWLEAGLIGLISMTLVIAWLTYKIVGVWCRGVPGGDRIDNLLACASSLALILLLAHSAVDYPLRTAALASVFAFAAAMLIAPVGRPPSGSRVAADGTHTRVVPTAVPARFPPSTDAGTESPRMESGSAASERPRNMRQAGFVPVTSREDWPEEWRQ